MGGVLGNVGKLPRQGRSVVETCQKINLWAASHEKKRRRVTTKQKEKVQVNEEINSRGLHRTMLMDGGEGKIGIKCCDVMGIEHQREKKGNIEGTAEDGGVCSPMSVTRLKQGHEEG